VKALFVKALDEYEFRDMLWDEIPNSWSLIQRSTTLFPRWEFDPTLEWNATHYTFHGKLSDHTPIFLADGLQLAASIHSVHVTERELYEAHAPDMVLTSILYDLRHRVENDANLNYPQRLYLEATGTMVRRAATLMYRCDVMWRLVVPRLAM
jgi:hypothetical protein